MDLLIEGCFFIQYSLLKVILTPRAMCCVIGLGHSYGWWKKPYFCGASGCYHFFGGFSRPYSWRRASNDEKSSADRFRIISSNICCSRCLAIWFLPGRWWPDIKSVGEHLRAAQRAIRFFPLGEYRSLSQLEIVAPETWTAVARSAWFRPANFRLCRILLPVVSIKLS